MSHTPFNARALVQAAIAASRGDSQSEKTAASPDSVTSLLKEAETVQNALEFVALASVNDGTAAGQIKQAGIRELIKRASGAGTSPPESVPANGTQAVPPQAGSTTLSATGKKGGNSPGESVPANGTQYAPEQVNKSASRPSLLDILQKHANDTTSAPPNAPEQSLAGENAEDPGRKGENSNIELVRSEQGIVSATRHAARQPGREMLKKLFAHAGDTGPSRAAAAAAFPTATAKGGLKEAADPAAVAQQAHGFFEEAGAHPGRERAALVALPLGMWSGPLAAQHGHGWGTALGSIVGGSAGGTLGGTLGHGMGYTLGGPAAGLAGSVIGGTLGGLAGRGLGAYYGHGRNDPPPAPVAAKEAMNPSAIKPSMKSIFAKADAAVAARSAAAAAAKKGADVAEAAKAAAPVVKKANTEEALVFFQKAASGELGPEAQNFARYVESLPANA